MPVIPIFVQKCSISFLRFIVFVQLNYRIIMLILTPRQFVARLSYLRSYDIVVIVYTNRMSSTVVICVTLIGRIL